MRTIALMGAASAAIHQLRYAIGYGDNASRALAAHPHGYLEAALPGIVTAVVIALAATLLRLARRERAARAGSLSLVQLWLACAFALAAIYGVQETLEGSGAILGGGWIGIALAVPGGLLVAVALRGARAAESTGTLVRLLAIRLVGMHVLAARTRTAPLPATRTGRARGPPTLSVV